MLAYVRAAFPAILRVCQLDFAFVVGLTALAAVPRMVLLSDIPAGLHGDEAWTGINARQILAEGWIGPYVGSALGYPSGPLYFAAPFVKVFGDTIFAVRFPMAVLGTVSIPLAYLTFRFMFDRTHAAIAGIFLAVGVWHLHYSRLAFPLISWPMMVLLTMLFLFLGIQTKRWVFYGLAGLAFGAGIYAYNAHPVFIIALSLFILWLAVRFVVRRERAELLRFGGRIALMAVMSIIAALPMIQYVMDSDSDYFARHGGIAVYETASWKSGSFLDRADLLYDGARDFVEAAFWSGEPDGADGAGHQAMIDRLSLVLVICGLAIFLWRWRQPAYTAVLIMVAVLPIATIITTNGMFRQSIGIVPFLAVLAAAPLASWWKHGEERPITFRMFSYVGVALTIGIVAFLNLRFYFSEYPDTPVARGTFGPEMTDASLFVNDLKSDMFVYFYSSRWSFYYETRRYLAPDQRGEDRSEEFGEAFSLEPDPTEDVAYVFLGNYRQLAGQVEENYPGGTRVEEEDFAAYLLPRSEEPVPTPTPVPPGDEGRQRDADRARDLADVRFVLEAFAAEHGSYPSTGGSLQSLCVYRELDAGCALEALEELPHDPLGDPGANGYFYSSDGSSFVVYAQRESDAFPRCSNHPEFLRNFDAVLCVSGP